MGHTEPLIPQPLHRLSQRPGWASSKAGCGADARGSGRSLCRLCDRPTPAHARGKAIVALLAHRDRIPSIGIVPQARRLPPRSRERRTGRRPRRRLQRPREIDRQQALSRLPFVAKHPSRTPASVACCWATAQARSRRRGRGEFPDQACDGGASRRARAWIRDALFAETRAHERACTIAGLRRQNAPRAAGSAGSSAATAVRGIGRFRASGRSVADAAIHGGARAPQCRSERSEREQRIAVIAGRR